MLHCFKYLKKHVTWVTTIFGLDITQYKLLNSYAGLTKEDEGVK